ncbi:MAG: hypothetical protein H6736_05380 [Alphaproteobacteria bacterium]|nr:hypothetical protein [Alphaproteobacteria bacterium]
MTPDHRAHVRMAWDAVATGGVLHALDAVPAALRALAPPGKYHATLTWAWVLLVAERYRADEPWPAFEARCPELFERDLVARRYPSGQLARSGARAAFELPR